MMATSKIVAMTNAQKADLVAKCAWRVVQGRYVGSIALASLENTLGYLELQFTSTEHLALVRTGLEPWEVGQMLRVGRKLLALPLLDEAFRNDVLSWAKVKALVPHVTRENVAEWIERARSMTSNALEHFAAQGLDPLIGDKLVAMYVPQHGRARFRDIAQRMRVEARNERLPEGECFLRLLDEWEAKHADPETALPTLGPVLPVPHSPERSRHIPVAIRKAALQRARHCCEICHNRRALVFHHAVIPFAEGGPHSLANIMVVCGRCHTRAHEGDRLERTSAAGCQEVMEADAAPAPPSPLAPAAPAQGPAS
jgi:hypothetical protein